MQLSKATIQPGFLSSQMDKMVTKEIPRKAVSLMKVFSWWERKPGGITALDYWAWTPRI